jgi:Zn-dependent protease with chaperone function
MIQGYWHPKGSASRVGATFSINNTGRYAVELENGTIYRGEVSHLNVSERLSNVERKVTLENDSLFVTLDNDAIDTIFKSVQKINGLVHYLETHMGWIAVALIVTLFSAFSFFKWGVPWTSQKIAHALPYETNKLIASGTMDFLDKYMFEESNLSKHRQDEIREHFKSKIAPLSSNDDNEIEYTLHFRSWSMGDQAIPNALALPSGDIILTDKFVELSSNQQEIDSVLLHEMGHVLHRHGLEMLIEGTFVTVAVMMISGDGSGLGDMGIGLGSALVSSSYSRGHESEADLYAFEKMLLAKIDPVSFSNIMNRMTEYMSEENNETNTTKEQGDDVLDYFSSHPSTQERVELANRYSECFKQGLTVCK